MGAQKRLAMDINLKIEQLFQLEMLIMQLVMSLSTTQTMKALNGMAIN